MNSLKIVNNDFIFLAFAIIENLFLNFNIGSEIFW